MFKKIKRWLGIKIDRLFGKAVFSLNKLSKFLFKTGFDLGSVIIVQPRGGFGNRLKALNSAFFLSKAINRPLILIWATDKYMNCSMEKLFIMPGSIKVVEVGNMSRLSQFFKGKFYLWLSEHVLEEQEVIKLNKTGYDFKSLSKYKAIYIKAYTKFYEYLDFQIFNPVKSIQEKAEEVIRGFNSNTIGVHIRRADHRQSVRFSPTRYFIKLMELEIDRNKDTKFYLASESWPEKENLIKIFKERIIIYSRPRMKRTDEAEIIASLVDMICLSRTKKIIGSYLSTFCGVAAELHGVEKIAAVKEAIPVSNP